MPIRSIVMAKLSAMKSKISNDANFKNLLSGEKRSGNLNGNSNQDSEKSHSFIKPK